MKMSEVFSRLR